MGPLARKTHFGRLFAAVASLVVLTLSANPAWAAASDEPLKIDIIGTGRMGGAPAEHGARAGHELRKALGLNP